MLFNSLAFLLFFPVVTVVFYLLNHKLRWLWLLLASSFFYMFFKPVYILILAFTIIVDYFVGVELEKTVNTRRKKLLLVTSLAGNVLVLVIFKYYNFINENVSDLLIVFDIKNPIPFLNIILPIGLSFHTFQAMSYIIEVYRGNQKAEKHFGYYALYVMFYPQLVAGPIERPQNILHQFHEVKIFKYENLRSGLKLMIYGFFKKIVIADNISVIVNNVYENHTDNGITCIVAMLLFSIQIYCDFSGYSDIALGTAKCMGYDLMQNFNLPYFSTSITEFWRRWHISLSTWFRDYVYIPLGGNGNGKIKALVNLSVVFFISGLWHGASWNYIIWGVVHAALLIIERLFLLKFYKNISPIALIVFNFIILSFCWLLFRIENTNQLQQIINSIITLPQTINKQTVLSAFNYLGNIKLLVTCSLILFFVLVDSYFTRNIYNNYVPKNKIIQKFQFQFLILLIVLFGYVGEVQFIYFQF